MTMKLQKKGRRTECKLLKAVVKSHADALKMKRTLYEDKSMVPYSNEEALAYLMDNNLTRDQYVNTRVGAKKRRANIYPLYSDVKKAKIDCYPANIKVTEIGSCVAMQDLLDHTSRRIFRIITELLNTPIEGTNFEIVYKWGVDGTSDQARYRQRFTSHVPEDISETSLFVASLVPLQVQHETEDGKIPIWKKPRYSSPRFCRPILFEFAKETAERSREEVEKISTQISHLNPTMIELEEKEICVRHNLISSMISGKVCTALTEIASQNCQICRATPSKMNNLDAANVEVNPDALGFGISVLHTNIRAFECLLHVSYRLRCKKWMVTKPDDKKKLQEDKQRIQDRFRNETGLLIDVVLQGKGTTNDGNTATRFFRDSAKSAEITGLDVRIIERFGNILTAINCGHQINVEEFRLYALNTAKLFIELYLWFYLPAHVHKLLLHGAHIIQHLLLPLGQLSEEAAEASNKYVRKFRREHTRRNSRLNSNEDLMHMLMVSSDPFISNLRKVTTKRKEPIPLDVRRMLIIDEEKKIGKKLKKKKTLKNIII